MPPRKQTSSRLSAVSDVSRLVGVSVLVVVALCRARHGHWLDTDTVKRTVKTLLSRSTTGGFNSPSKYLRTP
eukprot:1179412-Prorocentrum_minimum.AAC.1